MKKEKNPNLNYNLPKRKWSPKFKAITITYPIRIDHDYYKNKKYCLILFYVAEDGK